MRWLLIISILLLFLGCRKKGCTDSYAINYNEKAKKEDGSCSYESDKFLGTYSVSDSVAGGMLPFDYYHKQYDFEIFRDVSAPNKITIRNFANFSVPYIYQDVSAFVDGNTFTLPNQAPISNELTPTEKTISGSGSISGDSIFFDYSFKNEFDESFGGRGLGKK